MNEILCLQTESNDIHKLTTKKAALRPRSRWRLQFRTITTVIRITHNATNKKGIQSSNE